MSILGHKSGCWATVVGIISTSAAATAQSLEIAPITVDLPAGRLSSTIRITNRGTTPTTVQIRSFAWSQPVGGEQLDPTREMVVSPPFSTLAAGDTQTVRIVLRKAALEREASYRLLVDQLPATADAGSIRVALRISLPVFAAAAGAARARLTWKLVGADPVKRTLVIRNDGTRRAKISALNLPQAATVPGFTFRYVLAGSEVAIPVEAGTSGWAAAGATLHVSATSDQGKVEADAPIVPAA